MTTATNRTKLFTTPKLHSPLRHCLQKNTYNNNIATKAEDICRAKGEGELCFNPVSKRSMLVERIRVASSSVECVFTLLLVFQLVVDSRFYIADVLRNAI